MSFDRLEVGDPFAEPKIPDPKSIVVANYFWRPLGSEPWRYAGALLTGEVTENPVDESCVCILPEPPYPPWPTKLQTEPLTMCGEDGKLIEEKYILAELPPLDAVL